MIVAARINYIKALQVSGVKFLFFIVLTIAINHLIQRYHWQSQLIPNTYIILMSSALGIFLGFRINAAYSRWRDGHGIFRDLMATSLSVMAQITVLTKSKSENLDALHTLKYQIAITLLRYVHLVRLELLENDSTDWVHTLKKITFNKSALFSDDIIATIVLKKRKGSYALSHLSKLIHLSNVESAIIYATPGELAKSLQQMILLEQTMVTLKNTPFPWGYQFYTRLFVWILPLLFILSTFNQLNITDNLVMSLIAVIFITTEQVAKNLDDPITNTYNGVPFDYFCRMLEIELLENLDIPHSLHLITAKKGILH